jgi:hypothetical protein
MKNKKQLIQRLPNRMLQDLSNPVKFQGLDLREEPA